jgi:hypothetical protein
MRIGLWVCRLSVAKSGFMGLDPVGEGERVGFEERSGVGLWDWDGGREIWRGLGGGNGWER